MSIKIEMSKEIIEVIDAKIKKAVEEETYFFINEIKKLRAILRYESSVPVAIDEMINAAQEGRFLKQEIRELIKNKKLPKDWEERTPQKYSEL